MVIETFIYIILEYKGEVGYLLYESSSIKDAEIYFEDVISYITNSIVDDIDAKTAISELELKLEYEIIPKGSDFQSIGHSTFFPIRDYELILIRTDEKIEDFSKLKRYVEEPSIFMGIMNILYEDGSKEDHGFDWYLN